jgi:hypothetical protein
MKKMHKTMLGMAKIRALGEKPQAGETVAQRDARCADQVSGLRQLINEVPVRRGRGDMGHLRDED